MSRLTRLFTRFASTTSRWAGHPFVFIACCAIVLTWAVTGPVFGFSDTWQLVINTGTTVVTFLMVFLIQNTQNRDNNALHAKLDELIRVSKADNYFIGIENLPQEELEQLLAELDKLAPQMRTAPGPDKVPHPSPKIGGETPPPRPAPSAGAKRRPPRRGPGAAAS